MPFNLGEALRRIKPQARSNQIQPRPAAELSWADVQSATGGALLLDTCVYIDVLQNRTSKGVDGLLASRVCHHSSVCLSELTHAFGRLDPKHPGTASALDNIRQTIQKMPPQRLHVPDASAWGQAGMVAGELARRSGLQSRHMGESKYLKDALIACQARMIGASVLTANIQDFDFISQILKGVQVLFYRWPEVVA